MAQLRDKADMVSRTYGTDGREKRRKVGKVGSQLVERTEQHTAGEA